MEKAQLKKLISEAMQELETISKANLSTEALATLFKESKSNDELKQDVVLHSLITEVTKRGGMIAKNIKSSSTASKNAMTFANEALAKLK
ncbi:hypothetical protein P7D33_07615 [Lactococcus petauri]|uniref:Uncharacterized protein n=1 Tax=Lactococcus garvieae TaxID=1363 RepID=A0AA46TVN4_9LACT|nr:MULTISPECIES: hypothetical protein [Lactococcus]MDT2620706.1 hypothetical protein [Lactococcus petauri]UYT10232.1 hypothetical protein OF801_09795 [Lactococcus garvieae]UYT12262.1 hypothetical protein OF800_09745 [Lactococcus garvieae]